MDPPSSQTPVRSFLKLLASAVVASALFIVLFVWLNPLAPLGGLEPGKPAPVIEAAGWFNGQPPSSGGLRGKVVVVDAWATWCLPCRMQAPELVEAYQKFRQRPVVFIGLTDEGRESLPKIREYLVSTGITWPNGYGAGDTLVNFETMALPATWVIGPDGIILWNHDSPGTLEQAIENALEHVDADKTP
jgi:thiol-disulfide isomerase/thioredoxin